MPALTSMAYPDANVVVMALLAPLAPTVLVLPNDFTPPVITVKRIAGRPDPTDVTDYPLMLVQFWGADYTSTQALAAAGQTLILTSPATQVTLPDGGKVLVDSAGLFVGEQELPDVYPDERRISTTYQFGWRRQYPPFG